MRFAVLDVGSNTVNLLVVDAHRGSAPVPVHSERMDLRLSEHITRDGRIGKRAADGLVRVVRTASERARELGSDEFLAFATSAIREAANGGDIIAQVRAQTDVRLTVLPGRDEAELTFLAVRRWYGWSSGRLLVVDIGGGSVELAVGTGEQPEHAVSVPLGAGRMFREFLQDDPPRGSQVRELRAHVRGALQAVAQAYAVGEVGHAVGTSKTFRQLARLAARTSRRGHDADERVLQVEDLDELCDRLIKMGLAERAQLPGISESRAPQLAAGSLVALEIMRALDIEQIEVCPWALREGIILRRLDTLTG
ncbi:MAG: Ppx/GppA family phosphatase [Actinomycetales bacterium]|nr:Ppx/GppA family phosphatase [Actinomycetales bacterium]